MIVTATVVTLFIISLVMLIGGFIPIQLFPNIDVEFSTVNIELPAGTDLDKTNELAKEVENILYKYPEIKTILLN